MVRYACRKTIPSHTSQSAAQLEMPQAKTALEHELSASFDSATKITTFISSAPFVLLSDSFSSFSEELGEAELWFCCIRKNAFQNNLSAPLCFLNQSRAGVIAAIRGSAL